ncbi:MAG: UvrD-helicase domain-containing protein, partial [Prevotella sp.]|nr:UvrD-helicase domain-containing protein [Prevotella sp.]
MLDNRLNKKQQEAVETTEGRIKIVAGAGSGKTSVLVHRYVYLVNELGIDPNNILCMTFTNKAAAEMKNRIGKLTASSNVNDFVCTIHGFSVKFIRKEGFRIGFPKNFSILDEEDEKLLAIQVMDECGIKRSEETTTNFIRTIRMGKAMSPYISDLWIGKPKNVSSYSDAFYKYVMKQMKSFSLDFNDLTQLLRFILVFL